MRETVTFVTQSKYFSPAFNAAIFDGPIRIYFAQYQEAQALKVYFSMQERLQDLRKTSGGIYKNRGRNIFIMLYPTPDTFELSFHEGVGATQAGPPMLLEPMGDDYVLGVRGPVEQELLEDIYQMLLPIVEKEFQRDQ